MRLSQTTLASLSVSLAAMAAAVPAHASSSENTMLAIAPSISQAPDTKAEPSIAQFTPERTLRDHRIDYSYLDEALGFIVIPMGPSLREGAPTVQANTGTRRIYGHQSRYRLEGNRVAFSFLNDDIRSGLRAYREDLERVGSELGIASLPRNEQLAFWLNLHNVAVIEALAFAYPLQEPSEERFGPNAATLDDAKLVTIAGVSLSPRDIREGIVYPNWRDPKVIYGFWRGEIGGPSIQRTAFTGGNVDALLSLSGEEFVNSLRGVERFSGALQVSKVFEEAAPFYFEDFGELRSHIAQYARNEVKSLMERTQQTRYNRYETDVADLTRGEHDPGLNNFGILADPVGGDRRFRSYTPRTLLNPNSRFSLSIQRLIQERNAKLKKANRRGIRTGMVIYGDGQYSGPQEAPEVE